MVRGCLEGAGKINRIYVVTRVSHFVITRDSSPTGDTKCVDKLKIVHPLDLSIETRN